MKIQIVLSIVCLQLVLGNGHVVDNCPLDIYGLQPNSTIKCSESNFRVHKGSNHPVICYPIQTWFSFPANIQYFPRCPYSEFKSLAYTARSLFLNNSVASTKIESTLQIIYEFERLFNMKFLLQTTNSQRIQFYFSKLNRVPQTPKTITNRLKYLIKHSDFIFKKCKEATIFNNLKDSDTKALRTFLYNLQLVNFNANYANKLHHIESVMRKVVPAQKEFVLNFAMKLYDVNINHILHYCDTMSSDHCQESLIGVDLNHVETGYIMKLQRPSTDKKFVEIQYYNLNDLNEDEVCRDDDCLKENILNAVHFTKKCFSGLQYVDDRKTTSDFSHEEISELLDKSREERNQECLQTCLLVELCKNNCFYEYTTNLMDYLASVFNDIETRNLVLQEQDNWNKTHVQACIKKPTAATAIVDMKSDLFSIPKTTSTTSTTERSKTTLGSVATTAKTICDEGAGGLLKSLIGCGGETLFHSNLSTIKIQDEIAGARIINNYNVYAVFNNYQGGKPNTSIECNINDFCKNNHLQSMFCAPNQLKTIVSELNSSKINETETSTTPSTTATTLKPDNILKIPTLSYDDNEEDINYDDEQENEYDYMMPAYSMTGQTIQSLEHTLHDPQHMSKLVISESILERFSSVERMNLIKSKIDIVTHVTTEPELLSSVAQDGRLIRIAKVAIETQQRCFMPWTFIDSLHKTVQICPNHITTHPSFGSMTTSSSTRKINQICRYEVTHLLTRNFVRIGIDNSNLFYNHKDNIPIINILEYVLIVLSSFANLNFELVDADYAFNNDIELNLVVGLNHFYDQNINGYFDISGILLIDPVDLNLNQIHRAFMHEFMHMLGMKTFLWFLTKKYKYFILGFSHYDDQPSILTSSGLNQTLMIYPLDIINLQLYYGIKMSGNDYMGLNDDKNLTSTKDLVREFGPNVTLLLAPNFGRQKRDIHIDEALPRNQTLTSSIERLKNKFQKIKFFSQKLFSPAKNF